MRCGWGCGEQLTGVVQNSMPKITALPKIVHQQDIVDEVHF
jgi:hypothetical protein